MRLRPCFTCLHSLSIGADKPDRLTYRETVTEFGPVDSGLVFTEPIALKSEREQTSAPILSGLQTLLETGESLASTN